MRASNDIPLFYTLTLEFKGEIQAFFQFISL